MDSSGSGAADCGVGSIVWVRRRNGSWWPGKILGPEELSSSHLTSPRSGTPVKLLGREDASIDWYNLEKSKRVKAFRCGEFDDCIERAESSQGMPIKKREKYARREDAILHALELEKQLLRKQGKSGAASERSRSKASSSVKKDVGTSSGGLQNNNRKSGDLKLPHSSKRLDASPEDDIAVSSPRSPKVKDRYQPSGEDDHSEVTPRMRGLQDISLRTASSKRKHSASGASDDSQKLTAENNSQAPSSSGPSTGNTSNMNGEEQMGGISRAKRSRCVYLPAGSSDTLDYKGTPSPNEMSTSLLGDDESHPHIENDSEVMEDVESDSSESNSSESESDSSETEPDLGEEMTTLSGGAVSMVVEADGMRGPETLEHESTSSEDPDDSALSGDTSHLQPHDHISVNDAVSKWQLKGKRNSRVLAKRFGDTTNGRGSHGSIYGTYYEERTPAFRHKATGQSSRFQRSDFCDGANDADFRGQDFGTQIVGFNSRRCSSASRAVPRGHLIRDMVDWEDWTWEDQPSLKGQWEDRLDRFDPMFVGRHRFGGRARSMLVDVDLKVQASYQKAPVPIVSLMSKLNGKAIIGHPIQIEALENGSTEALLSPNDYFGCEVADYIGNTALPPAWKTARRTNLRLPRSRVSAAIDGDEIAEGLSFLNQERKPAFRNSSLGGLSHGTNLTRKSLPTNSRSSSDKKSSRKLQRKVSLSSSQKTRTLSSIAVEQNLIKKNTYDSSSCQVNGLIKQESSGPPTVACIPVKLVFSRLLEKINRPPSKAASKVVLSNSDVVR